MKKAYILENFDILSFSENDEILQKILMKISVTDNSDYCSYGLGELELY